MKQATIYHNPNCSKSRQTLQIMQDHGLAIQKIHYLQSPPTIAELDQLCQAMQLEPLQLIRTAESVFNQLGLSVNKEKSRLEWLTILVENPILIERPIVKVDNQVVIGRPPETVLTIL